MNESNEKAERFFGGFAETVIRFRVPVALAVLLCAGLLASQIRFLTIDTSNEGFLRENDPILITYNEFRDQFGRDDMLALAVHSENIFSSEFLVKLKKLHEELGDTVPHVNDITSMVNARSTRGEGDVLEVDDLLVHFPESAEDFEVLRQRVMSNPLYLNQLISRDGTFTSIVIESDVYTGTAEDDLLSGFDEVESATQDNTSGSGKYLSDKENTAMVRAVQQIVEKYDSENFRIFMAGTPVVTNTVKQFMMKDMRQFLLLAVLTIGICLFLMFRRVSGVIMPLLIVAFSLVSTLGIMALCDIQFKTPTIILPSFLLAVGVGACVHVLSLTFQDLRRGKLKEQAIIDAFSHSGFAIVMTSLTTAAGLASFGMAKVAPIGDLGLFSAIGVMIALLYTLTLLPALLAMLPLKKKSGEVEQKETVMDRVMDAITDFSVDRYRFILVLTVIIFAISIAGVTRIQVSHNVLKWLPDGLDVRQDTETIDHELRGSVVLEVILDTGRVNGLYDRQTLLAMDRVVAQLEEQFQDESLFIGKAITVTTIIKEINQALHENDPEFYAVPKNEKLIPQEFLLFENSGSDDLQDVVDSQFQLARITLKVPWRDALSYVPFIASVEKHFNDEFAGKKLPGGQEMQVTVTGIMSLFGRIIQAVIFSAIQSYGIALVIITLMMILLIGDLRLGLLSMIPNLGPILAVLGFMGWMSIPLDMFTMLIASIAIGLAVDDTVHFMYNFKRYFRKTENVREAVRHTLHTAGRAMLTTSVVLSIGFFLFMFASMNNVYYFGMLTGFAIILALAGDLFLAPALMTLVIKEKQDVDGGCHEN